MVVPKLPNKRKSQNYVKTHLGKLIGSQAATPIVFDLSDHQSSIVKETFTKVDDQLSAVESLFQPKTNTFEDFSKEDKDEILKHIEEHNLEQNTKSLKLSKKNSMVLCRLGSEIKGQ